MVKRFIDEIVINNQELVEPVVKGIEATPNLEVEIYEKPKIDLDRNRAIPGETVVALKIFKHEFFN